MNQCRGHTKENVCPSAIRGEYVIWKITKCWSCAVLIINVRIGMHDITLKRVFIVSEKGKLCLLKEKRLFCTIVPTVILCSWAAFRLTICVKIFALGRSVSLIFCPANAKLALTLDYNCHWKYHQFHSCFRSSTIKLYVCLLGRLVPVLSDTDGLAWIIFQLPHVSLFVCDKKSEGKRDVFIMVSQHGV